jgi:hypothetical protein
VDVEQDARMRLRAGEQPLEYEIAWTARDGQTHLMSLYGSVLLNAEGKLSI